MSRGALGGGGGATASTGCVRSEAIDSCSVGVLAEEGGFEVVL